MRYAPQDQAGQYPYPDHHIDPKKKGKDFCLQYARAAWHDWQASGSKMFAGNGGSYTKYKMYALGKQPVDIYKKLLGVDMNTDQTWLSIDWSIRPIVATYRDKAISRLMEQSYDLVATPIDAQAHAEAEAFYADMKARMAVRKLMEQQSPELAQHPMIAAKPGEPMDEEELEKRMEAGEQFNRARDAEDAINVGFYENKKDVVRRGIFEDLFDLGVAGTKEWLGGDNKAKFRKGAPGNVVISNCKEPDFSDAVHIGELIDVPLIELATLTQTDKEGNEVRMFSEDELIELSQSVLGKWGNPQRLGAGSGSLRPYDKFKAQVLDLEFYSYDTHVWRDAPDAHGNPDLRKAEFGRGKKSEKYKRKTFKMVYKVKWIVGTDKCYDCGPAFDQKRSPNPQKKAETRLSYNFFAYNFHEMTAQSYMERLIPYLDDYQLTMLKVQNFKNRAVPSGWWIDLSALENVAMNKGGANMSPKELLQMFFDTGVLLGRSVAADGTPQGPNWKPVIPIENTAASELAMLYQDLVQTLGMIERITGFNDVTLGEASSKTLVPGYQSGEMATNHALFPLKFAEKQITQRLAEDVLVRMAQGVKKGEITGYAPYAYALNKNTLHFIKVSPGIALREYGIMLEERSTESERAWLMQQVQGDIANGFLDTGDAIAIIYTHNVKSAMLLLSYKVKKAKEAAHKQEMEKIALNNQGAQEAATAAFQMKMQEKQADQQFELQKEQMKLQAELAKEEMRIQAELQKTQMELQVKFQIGQGSDQARVQASAIQADAKVTAQSIAHETKVISDTISGEAALEKQRIANAKPVPKSSTKK
jgi:hypothetical protein